MQNQQSTLVSQNASNAVKEVRDFKEPSFAQINIISDTSKPYTISNKQVRRIGQIGVSVDSKKGIAFRHAYKDS
jgi:2',3'-cyclic-nucleotide 2'-phosphodiesterase (5'-nucleotidase family)